MAKTSKIIIGIIIAVIVIGGIWYEANRKPAEKGVIKIGVILPLTGNAATYGVSAKEGIDLALEELNVAQKRKLELVYEDDQCDPEKAVSAAQKLINIDNVKIIIGHICSSAALAVAPIAEKNKVILFSPGASTPEYKNAGDYIFRNRQDISNEVIKTAEIVRNFKADKIAIIYINNDYGLASRKVFSEKFKKLGGDVIAEENYQPDSTDFRTQLIKIKKVKPNGIFLAGQIKDSAMVIKQASELGIKTQFFSTIGVEGKELIEIAGPAAEDIIYTSPFFDVKSNETVVKNFIDKFKQKYKKEPTYVFAANAYDALMILNLIIKKCGDNTDCIKNELYKIRDYPGVSGKTTFDEYGEVDKPLMIKTVKNGQFVPYGQ